MENKLYCHNCKEDVHVCVYTYGELWKDMTVSIDVAIKCVKCDTELYLENIDHKIVY